MPFSVIGLRRSLLTGAGLLVCAAVVIGVVVIPRVKADTSPGVAASGAVTAFLLHMAFDLLVAMELVWIGRKTRLPSRLGRIGLGLSAFVVVLFGMALIDAAFAYYSDSPAMAFASVMLCACCAAEVAAGLLSGGAALFLPATERP